MMASNNQDKLINSVTLPPVIFGTSSLGNLYQALPYPVKKEIVKECVSQSTGIPVFDTAGKYGAGMALSVLGQSLAELNIDRDQVLISNKLGWYQMPLITDEPLFEKDVWVNLKNDAVQKISYNGILECFHQGNGLLGNYKAQMVSVHDPDEYLAMAKDKIEEDALYQDVLDAYTALIELKQQGIVKSVGIGCKNWKVIKKIVEDVPLDWVMVANSLTVKSHPQDLLDFITTLKEKGIAVINSAVFNGGFLIGSDFYNYQKVNEATVEGRELIEWRTEFYQICREFDVKPADACFRFSFDIPGVNSIALNTTKPEKVKENIEMVNKTIPDKFWEAMFSKGLITTTVI